MVRVRGDPAAAVRAAVCRPVARALVLASGTHARRDLSGTLGLVGVTGGVMDARGGRSSVGPWPTVVHGASGLSGMTGGPDGPPRHAFVYIHTYWCRFYSEMCTRVPEHDWN